MYVYKYFTYKYKYCESAFIVLFHLLGVLKASL